MDIIKYLFGIELKYDFSKPKFCVCRAHLEFLGYSRVDWSRGFASISRYLVFFHYLFVELKLQLLVCSWFESFVDFECFSVGSGCSDSLVIIFYFYCSIGIKGYVLD